MGGYDDACEPSRLIFCASSALSRCTDCRCGQSVKETVEADVSTRSVAITSSFTGTEILVFGTVENSRAPSAEAGTYDVVVVVEGTPGPALVRKKAKVGGLWINSRKVRFASFPSYYAIASTRPVDEIAEKEVRNACRSAFRMCAWCRPAA